MEDLIGRFEPPNAARRWDNPLFTVHPGDSLPFEDIAEALFYGKTRNVSLATVPVRNFLSLYQNFPCFLIRKYAVRVEGY